MSSTVIDPVASDLELVLRRLKLGKMLDTCPSGSPLETHPSLPVEGLAYTYQHPDRQDKRKGPRPMSVSMLIPLAAVLVLCGIAFALKMLPDDRPR